MKPVNQILILLLISAFWSCKNNDKTELDNQAENQDNAIIKSSQKEKTELDDSDCPKVTFNKILSPEISIKGFYYECEPLWKQDIEFVFGGIKTHKTDSLIEYKFQDYNFPVFIENEEFTQIILERDDRPLKNFLEVFRFKKSKLDSIYKIPFFEMKPKDLDNDGIKEFYATLEMVELLGENGNIGYNPILAYEISKSELTFDLATTKIANERAYGKFHGLKIDNSLKFNGNDVEKNWP